MAKKNNAVAKVADEVAEVAGVKLAVVKEALIDAAIAKIEGVKVPPGEWALAERVTFLEMHNRRNVPQASMVKCEVCGLHSHEAETSCPGCGDDGDEEFVVEEAELEADPINAAVAEINATVDAAHAGDAARKVKKAAATAPTKQPPVALVKAAPSVETKMSAEAHLDQANARIEQLKRQGAKNYWEIGRELFRVFDGHLWKSRVVEGKAAYKSFEQYVAAEVGFSHTQSYAMMDVARKYDEEVIAKIGFSKLSIVLKAPEDVQLSLLDEVEKGMSSRELKGRVREERSKPGAKLPKAKRNDPSKQASPGPPLKAKVAEATSRMTVAAVEGTRRLSLYAKPSGKLAIGELPDKRAKRLSDVPIAFEELANGVVVYYQVVNSPGGLALKIETKRRK